MTNVSIVMPLYNKALYVKAAIASILAQTHSLWELWVIDNGSTDDGATLVQSFQDSRIHLRSFPTRTGGPGAPRNFGLSYATGNWVLFLDADDYIKPDHLTNLLTVTQSHPDAAIIAGHWQEFSEHTPDQRILKSPAGYGTSAIDFPESAIAFAPWAVHAALIRRNILQEPFRWVESLDPFMSEDTAFWFRLTSTFPVAYSTSDAALYRKDLEGNRNQPNFPALWFKAMKEVTAANLQFLEQQQKTLTAKHCEILMRLFSGIYLQARSQQDRKTAQEAIALAQHWLQECIIRDGCRALPLQIRQRLGLKPFLELMYWRQRFT